MLKTASWATCRRMSCGEIVENLQGRAMAVGPLVARRKGNEVRKARALPGNDSRHSRGEAIPNIGRPMRSPAAAAGERPLEAWRRGRPIIMAPVHGIFAEASSVGMAGDMHVAAPLSSAQRHRKQDRAGRPALLASCRGGLCRIPSSAIRRRHCEEGEATEAVNTSRHR